MSKRSAFLKSTEVWNIAKPGTATERVLITKAVVRDRDGRFHGATNYPVNLRNVVKARVQA